MLKYFRKRKDIEAALSDVFCIPYMFLKRKNNPSRNNKENMAINGAIVEHKQGISKTIPQLLLS